MINDIREKKDYKKEIKTIDEKLIKINTEKKELIMMRMRKEIDLKEYNNLKDEMDSQIKILEDNKEKLLDKEKNKQSKEENFAAFKKKVNELVFSDDEKILDLAQTFFKEILVESVKDDVKAQKVILHAKLNVLDIKTEKFDFEKFLLLFCTRQGCCHDDS